MPTNYTSTLETHLTKLGLPVRLICLDLFVNDRFEIPNEIRWGKKKNAVQRPRSKQPSGEKLAENVENVSLKSLLREFEAAGYGLANAYPWKHASGKRVVRFVFKHKDRMEMTPEFEQARSEPRGFFGLMCESLWRVSAVYLNPFYEDGVEHDNEEALQITLGSQRQVENGRKLASDYSLCVVNNDLQITPAQ